MSKSRSSSSDRSSRPLSPSSSSNDERGKIGKDIVRKVLDRKKLEAGSRKRSRELDQDLQLSDKSPEKEATECHDRATECVDPESKGEKEKEPRSKTDQLLDLLSQKNLEQLGWSYQNKRLRHAQEFREQAYFEQPENVERMRIGSRTYPHPCSK